MRFQTIRTQLKCSAITRENPSMLNHSSRWSSKTKWQLLSLMKSRQLKLTIMLITFLTKRELTLSRATLTWSSKFKRSNLLRSLEVVEETIPETVKLVWLIQLGWYLLHLLILMMLEQSKRSHQQSQWSSRVTLKLLEVVMFIRQPPKSLPRVKTWRRSTPWKSLWMLYPSQQSFHPRPLTKLERKSISTLEQAHSTSWFKTSAKVLLTLTATSDLMAMVQSRSIKNWM